MRDAYILEQDATGTPETTKPNLVGWAKCLISLGWLMGLEPTTTGITILTFYYSSLSIYIDILHINHRLSLILQSSDLFNR